MIGFVTPHYSVRYAAKKFCMVSSTRFLRKFLLHDIVPAGFAAVDSFLWSDHSYQRVRISFGWQKQLNVDKLISRIYFHLSNLFTITVFIISVREIDTFGWVCLKYQ